MLGTAVTGSFINFLYKQNLEKTLINADQPQHITELSNPNILIQTSHSASNELPIDLAQQVLLDTLSLGLFASAGICLISLLILWKVPPMVLFKR
ncbi:hypothetical protein OA79_04910 [Marinomonas sp. TW1]|nr:hypothetical protein OA79_04910 [Marinomonas sp. TW1]